MSTVVMCKCCRTPDDWVLTCGGSGQIWVWGHNHRGQLGGVDGAKVKLPVSCDALATLRPVQVVGGEQTLFAVTGDGKVRSPLQPQQALTGIGTTLTTVSCSVLVVQTSLLIQY